MPLADYAHHNEDAERIWWEEEGKHDTNEPPEPDDEGLDLADHDEFECDGCHSIFDVEDSQESDGEWLCPDCASGPVSP